MALHWKIIILLKNGLIEEKNCCSGETIWLKYLFAVLGVNIQLEEVEFPVLVHCSVCLVYFYGSIADNFPNYTWEMVWLNNLHVNRKVELNLQCSTNFFYGFTTKNEIFQQQLMNFHISTLESTRLLSVSS